MSSSLNGPDLPIELWTKILCLAGGPNDSTEFRGIDYTGPMCCILPVSKPGSLRESLKTKRSMVLVNREWNTIATPILYEHLTISKRVEFKKLLATLTLEGDAELSLGRFVRRLDLTNNAPDGIPVGVAIELCQKMTNLVTFFVQLEVNINPVPLLAALGPQLRHLHIQDYEGTLATSESHSSISFANLLEFLNIHPNLTSVSFPFVLTGLDEAPDESLANDSKVRRWPSIRKWTFQHPSQTSALGLHMPRGAFPSLTEVGFDHCTSSTFWSWEMKDFLAAHGDGLLTVGLGQGGEVQIPEELSRPFQHIKDFCPRTTEVDISFKAHEGRFRKKFALSTAWLAEVIRIPQITTLGVRICSPRHNDERTHRLHCAVALPWPKVFPKLERIRVLEELEVDRYRMHDEVTRQNLTLPARWATRPIRVEDLSGTTLGELSKGLCTLVEM